MRHSAISLMAVCLTWSTALPAVAQSNGGSTQQTTTVSATTGTEQRKSEVDLMLEDAEKNGQPIMDTGVECGEEPASTKAEGLEGGVAIELPQPHYPPIAFSARATGTVRVKVIIDIDGKVIAAHAISGHPILQAAGVAAARNALFTPWKYNGTPVIVAGVICYSFVR